MVIHALHAKVLSIFFHYLALKAVVRLTILSQVMRSVDLSRRWLMLVFHVCGSTHRRDLKIFFRWLADKSCSKKAS